MALRLGAAADVIGRRTAFAVVGAVCVGTVLVYVVLQQCLRSRAGKFDLEIAPV